MKVKILCLIIVMALCGCERSVGMDVMCFCENFNRRSTEIKITNDDITRDSENGDYYINIAETLVRLKCGENNEIVKCIITGKNKNETVDLSENVLESLNESFPKEFIAKIRNNKNEVITESEICRYVWFETDGFQTMVWERII